MLQSTKGHEENLMKCFRRGNNLSLVRWTRDLSFHLMLQYLLTMACSKLGQHLFSSISNNNLNLNKSLHVAAEYPHLSMGTATHQPHLRQTANSILLKHRGFLSKVSHSKVIRSSSFPIRLLMAIIRAVYLKEYTWLKRLTNWQSQTPFSQFAQHPPLPQSPVPYQQPFPQTTQQYVPPGPNLGILHRDVDSLIRSHKAELVTKPYDAAIQPRLSALLDLQGVLRTGQLPPDQVQQVRDQVDALMASSASSATPAAPTPTPYSLPSYPLQQTPTPTPILPQAPPTVDLSSLLSSNNLADIIAKAQRASATPPVAHASLVQDRPSSAAGATPSSTDVSASGGSDLIASLRNPGILTTPATSTPTNGVLPFVAPPKAGRRGPGPVIDVQLKSASLKM